MDSVLLHSPSQIIRKLLIDLGAGSDGGATWPIFYSKEPDKPSSCLTVYDTPGFPQGQSQLDGFLYQLYGFQVRATTASYAPGWTKMDEVQTKLATLVYRSRVTLDSTSYIVWNISRIGSIFRLGQDPRNAQEVFTLNATARIKVLA